MRGSRTKAFLSIVATLVSAFLAMIYWLAPAWPDSHPLHVLLIDCIPDSIVVLLAIPIVYWLFYRRGLTNMGDCPLFVGRDEVASLHHRSGHARPSGQLGARRPTQRLTGDNERDVLIVVDAQRDCLAAAPRGRGPSEIIEPLNVALRVAESRHMLVIFTKHCHPPQQCSVNPGHRCTMNTPGGELSPDLYIPAGSVLFECGADPDALASSALDNPAVDLLVSNPRVRTVYVAGVALEHCVRATCASLLERGKKTIAIENAIIAAGDDAGRVESVWTDLIGRGLIREESLANLARDSESNT